MTKADRGTVAVLGAGGTMGLGMARNLARAGFDVRGWNRSREKAEPLVEDGVTVVETPGRAAAGAGFIVTILADADAVVAAMDGPEGGLGRADPSTVWLQMSTIGEAGTERCAELAGRPGIAFVDAPVVGTKQPAREGKLTVLASGPDGVRERVQPIFDAIGQKTMWVGAAGQGTRLKLVTNNWILAVVEGAAETIALAEGLGVDPDLFFEAVDGGPLDLPYLRLKGRAIVERDFEPSFSLSLAAKDARLVEEAAARRHLDLPLTRMIRERLDEGADEHGAEDVSATYWMSAP
ncbi:MAG TPA: NAD(P)-dependent oxidoreductase [Solirubrobacteraceae bacterium]|nr:NAD(P)-dependent oxidoreductase [Solirubrobacteraceae bacterium]